MRSLQIASSVAFSLLGTRGISCFDMLRQILGGADRFPGNCTELEILKSAFSDKIVNTPSEGCIVFFQRKDSSAAGYCISDDKMITSGADGVVIGRIPSAEAGAVFEYPFL